MIDLDNFIISLKCSWVTKINTIDGKWSEILLHYISKTGLTLDYVMKMNVKCIDELPILNVIPQFYRDIFLVWISIGNPNS